MTPASQQPDASSAMLHAYLDGELSVTEALEVERMIARDSNLAAEAAAVKALKQALHDLQPDAPPATLVNSIERRFGVRRPVRPSWTALAASIVLATGLSSALTLGLLRETDDRIYAESTDSHLRALLAPRPVDVPSSERHIVKPWFNGKSVQSPKVPDLAAQGFPLVGGRIDVIAGSPVPAVVYTRRLHTISVWAASDQQASKLSRASASIKGTNLTVWRTDGMTYWAASDLNSGELSTFARAHAQAQ